MLNLIIQPSVTIVIHPSKRVNGSVKIGQSFIISNGNQMD